MNIYFCSNYNIYILILKYYYIYNFNIDKKRVKIYFNIKQSFYKIKIVRNEYYDKRFDWFRLLIWFYSNKIIIYIYINMIILVIIW